MRFEGDLYNTFVLSNSSIESETKLSFSKANLFVFYFNNAG